MRHRSLVAPIVLVVVALVASLTAPSYAAGGGPERSAAKVGAKIAAKAAVPIGLQPARQLARQAALRAARKAEAARKRLAALKANPLRGRPWGTYKGPGDQAWAPYTQAGGEEKRLLGRIALTPRAKWFGAWIGDNEIEGNVRAYIDNAAGGNQKTLVQMAVFRMVPWEHEACGRLPSGGEQASYKRWIDGFARGVGSQHAAIILQPDGPFVDCVPGRSRIPSDLIAYAAQKFGALPHTSTYIDGGAADWPPGAGGAAEAADFLVRDGVQHVRGIALNSTHYSATGDEVERGAAIVAELARRGIRGKKVVVNTSSNGRPFVFGDAPGKDPDNATVCASRSSQHCVTLGIRPTVEVADRRWGLSQQQRRLARKHVDAYLWFGRPWLYRQNDPFDKGRALQLVRTTPY